LFAAGGLHHRQPHPAPAAGVELRRRDHARQRRRRTLPRLLRRSRPRAGRFRRAHAAGGHRHRPMRRRARGAGVLAGLGGAGHAGGEPAPGQRLPLSAPVRPAGAKLRARDAAAGRQRHAVAALGHRGGGRPCVDARRRAARPARGDLRQLRRAGRRGAAPRPIAANALRRRHAAQGLRPRRPRPAAGGRRAGPAFRRRRASTAAARGDLPPRTGGGDRRRAWRPAGLSSGATIRTRLVAAHDGVISGHGAYSGWARTTRPAHLRIDHEGTVRGERWLTPRFSRVPRLRGLTPMKRTTLLLLAGLSAGFAAHAAEPATADAPATGSYAGVTVAIDPATGRLRAPTAAEQAALQKATVAASRLRTADRMSIAKPGPKTRAEAERTTKRHRDGRVSMQVSEDMMSYVTATQLEDGSIVIGHGDAHGHAAPATTVESARE